MAVRLNTILHHQSTKNKNTKRFLQLTDGEGGGKGRRKKLKTLLTQKSYTIYNCSISKSLLAND